MNDAFQEEVDELFEVIKECTNYLSIARDSDLQKEAIAKLAELTARFGVMKADAVAAADEDRANFLLGCEYSTRAISAELSMWLLFKEDKPEDAWNSLVVAQMATTAVIRANARFAHVESHAERLLAIEKLIFPPQAFMSVGILVESKECSICGGEYGECSHVVGRPYMGEFCHTIISKAKLEEVSLVNEPANKHCRVTHFSEKGGRRNKMTWRLEAHPENADPSTQGQMGLMEAIVATEGAQF
jgi:hypothetical protein